MRRSQRVAAGRAAGGTAETGGSRFMALPIELQEKIIDAVVRDAGESDDMAIAAARLVCRAWRRLIGARLTGTIIPASFQTADHLAAFPAVTIIDLRDAASCGAVSTKAVRQIPRKLPGVTHLPLGPLRSLTLPCVKALAQLTGLQMLSFEGCPHLKDDHLKALAPLSGTLTALVLNGCSAPQLSSDRLRCLSALTQLRQLGLREVQLADKDLEFIGCHCTQLDGLDVSDAYFFHGSGIAGLAGLTLLALTGGINIDPPVLAAALSRLTNLSILALSAWSLPSDTEEGAAAVRQLTNLRSLAVWEGNDVDDEPPSWPKGLAGHTQLQEVTLAHFDLMEDFEAYSKSWSTQLQDLDLRGAISLPEDALVSIARRFGGLTRINLQENSTAVKDGSCAEMVRCLTALRVLDLRAFSGAEPGCANVIAMLAQLPALQELDLSDADCIDIRPLAAATGLTRLALSGFALPPQHEGLTKGLHALKALPALSVLVLNENDLKATTMRAIAGLTNLTELYIAVSTVTDAGFRQLSRLSRLQTLDASMCFKLTPKGIGALFNLPDLRELSLQGSGSRTRDPWPSPSKFAYPYLRIRTS